MDKIEMDVDWVKEVSEKLGKLTGQLEGLDKKMDGFDDKMEEVKKELFGRVRSLEDFRATCKGLGLIGAIVGIIIGIIELIQKLVKS